MKSIAALLTVMRKELRDILRDRRTLLLALGLGPLLAPILLVGMGTLGENRARNQIEKPLELPVVGREHAPNLIAWLEGQNVVIKAPPRDVDAAIAKQEEDVILRIGADFPTQWRKSLPAPVEIIQDSTRQDAEIPVRRLQALLATYGGQAGSLRLLARGVSPGTATAIQIRQTEGFSQGQRTKTAIARALVHDPHNVVLDEPTNGLDVMTTRSLREFLKELRGEGRCVVFSSHIMQEVAALCDRIVIVARGRVVASGTADELRAQTGEENLEDAFVKAIGSEEGLHA